MRCLIVHNPRSGFGSDAVFAFERALIVAGDECVLRILDDSFDAVRALRDVDTFDLCVLSGGDGSISSMLYLLRGNPIPCCIFPSGTANLLFANLGNSPEPAALARACRWGDVATCDLGEVLWTDSDGENHARGFSLMAGSGFDAELMSAAAPNKKAMGEAAYFVAALCDPTPQVFHYTIELNGTTIERDGIACLVANNAMIQGDIEIVPGCVMNDGLLDVLVLEVADAVQLVRPLVSGLLDRKGRTGHRPRIETFRGADIRISTTESISMQVDGDVISTPVRSWRARALPGANKLIVDTLSRYHDESKRMTPRFPIDEQRDFPE